MDDASEFRWRYLKDNLDYSRHHETIRATSTNMVVAIAGVGFAVVGYDKCVATNDVVILVFLVCLGLFGVLFSAKQAERAAFHYERARALRQALDEGPHAPGFKELNELADSVHRKNYPWLSGPGARLFWYLLHLSISALSAILLGIAAFSRHAACS
jgi:hypothetical protein